MQKHLLSDMIRAKKCLGKYHCIWGGQAGGFVKESSIQMLVL